MVSIEKNNNIPVKNTKTNNKGTVRAIGSVYLTQIATLPVGAVILNNMPRFSKNLSKDQVEIVNKAADKVVHEVTNLGKKGVKIENFTHAGINLSGIPDKILELTNTAVGTAAGKNAAFCAKPLGKIAANTVIVNREKLPVATFHELGHAFNFNNSKFWGAVQKMRCPSMRLAALFAFLPALTKDAKAENGKELTKGQKFKNGLRKASPILAGLAMVPVLAEEGMASIRGCKWANQLLDKTLSKRVTKFNVAGFSTYVLTTAGIVLASLVGKKVKDNIQAKQEQKK